MKRDVVIAYFGGISATARALGMSRQGVWKWRNTIPLGRAYQVEVVTKGKLKADPSLYRSAA